MAGHCSADCHTNIVRLPVWSGDLRLVDGGDSAEGRLERCNDDRASTHNDDDGQAWPAMTRCFGERLLVPGDHDRNVPAP